MIKISLTVLVFIFFIASYSNAQEEFIWVAGMKLEKGMDKNEVIPKLKEKYKLSKFGDKDSWAITEQQGSKNEFLGQVAFRDNKLVWASRNWGFHSGENSYELGEALYGVLTNIAESGSDVAKISTTSQRAPGINVDTINLTFPNKLVSITISRGSKVDDGVSIQESFHHLND